MSVIVCDVCRRGRYEGSAIREQRRLPQKFPPLHFASRIDWVSARSEVARVQQPRTFLSLQTR